MSDLNDSAKSVKNFAKNFRDVITVGEALEKIDNLEQATLYAQDQAEKTAEIRKENDKRLVESQNALNDAEGKVVAARTESNRLIDHAYEETDAIKLNAQVKADGILAEADAYAAQSQKNVDFDIQQRQGAKDAALAELADLEEKIEMAHAELASIKERLG